MPNSTVMAAYAERLGVPRQNIIEEDRSLTTYQNLLYSLRMVEEQGLRQATLVTLDLYTRRAVATARKLAWPNLHWLSVFSRGQPAYGQSVNCEQKALTPKRGYGLRPTCPLRTSTPFAVAL